MDDLGKFFHRRRLRRRPRPVVFGGGRGSLRGLAPSSLSREVWGGRSPPNTLQRLGFPTDNHPSLRGRLGGAQPPQHASTGMGLPSVSYQSAFSYRSFIGWASVSIQLSVGYQSALSYRSFICRLSVSTQLSVTYRLVISQHSVIGHLFEEVIDFSQTALFVANNTFLSR